MSGTFPSSTEKLLLRDPTVFPRMMSLDLSGKDDVRAEHLLPFLEAHPRLRFLGLALTEACSDDAFVDEDNRHEKLYRVPVGRMYRFGEFLFKCSIA